jgi:hypothetical protein
MKRFTVVDILMLLSAIASLIYSEFKWFNGDRETGLFVGLWVPSILAFAIYLKLIKRNNG